MHPEIIVSNEGSPKVFDGLEQERIRTILQNRFGDTLDEREYAWLSEAHHSLWSWLFAFEGELVCLLVETILETTLPLFEENALPAPSASDDLIFFAIAVTPPKSDESVFPLWTKNCPSGLKSEQMSEYLFRLLEQRTSGRHQNRRFTLLIGFRDISAFIRERRPDLEPAYLDACIGLAIDALAEGIFFDIPKDIRRKMARRSQ